MRKKGYFEEGIEPEDQEAWMNLVDQNLGLQYASMRDLPKYKVNLENKPHQEIIERELKELTTREEKMNLRQYLQIIDFHHKISSPLPSTLHLINISHLVDFTQKQVKNLSSTQYTSLINQFFKELFREQEDVDLNDERKFLMTNVAPEVIYRLF